MAKDPDAFATLLTQVGEHFGCALVNVVSRDYTPSMKYLCGRVNHLDPADEGYLREIFVRDNAFWQKVMLTTYSASYPLVCDVFASSASQLLVSLAHDRFEVFMVDGTYGEVNAYHQWVLAVSRRTKVGYFIDGTYIQFLPGVKTDHIVIGPDGRRMVMQDFSGLRYNVSNGLRMRKFPVAVTRVGSPESFRWNPGNFYAVLREAAITKRKNQ